MGTGLVSLHLDLQIWNKLTLLDAVNFFNICFDMDIYVTVISFKYNIVYPDGMVILFTFFHFTCIFLYMMRNMFTY